MYVRVASCFQFAALGICFQLSFHLPVLGKVLYCPQDDRVRDTCGNGCARTSLRQEDS